MSWPALKPEPQGCRMVYLSEKPPADAPEMLADYPDLLSVQHLCEITGLSDQTIRREIAEGRLPGCRIGRRLFVPAQTAAADIARGHGGIVAWQGKKYGVYRHTDGTLFAVDIRCPHRGCELTWNDDEKSWDCPCHGSRFDYTGRRLSEPAKAALKPCKDFPQEI